MGRKAYRIDEFFGIDQSRNENAIAPGMSADACNMDTENGSLAVAKGYVRHIPEPVPGTEPLHRLYVHQRREGEQCIAIAGDVIYAYRDGAWDAVYTYAPGLAEHRFDFAEAQIGGQDHLIIGCGEAQLVKYDGETASLFGSAEQLSDAHVLYLAMYRNRLFSAGDPEHPNRLYWSELPGSGRSIEGWGPVEASPNVEGGHTEVGDTGGDPITGLAALSNQLLIFKRHAVYRLLGDRPGNYIVEEVEARGERPAHTAIVPSGDALYYLTGGGLCCFNGVSAAPLPDARRIRTVLAGAFTADSRGALCRDKLYFTMEEGGKSALVEYDLMRCTYMMRRGFTAHDLAARGGTLYLLSGTRHVCRFGEGNTYDGAPISAWWQTPLTDLYDKGAVKSMRELYLRGSSELPDSVILMDMTAGRNTATHRMRVPDTRADVVEVPLTGEGRTFSMRFYNEAGGHFTLEAGVELAFEERRRTE